MCNRKPHLLTESKRTRPVPVGGEFGGGDSSLRPGDAHGTDVGPGSAVNLCPHTAIQHLYPGNEGRIQHGTAHTKFRLHSGIPLHSTVSVSSPNCPRIRTAVYRAISSGVALPDSPDGAQPAGRPSLGDLVSRPPRGVPYRGMEMPMVDAPGDDKRGWLTWAGTAEDEALAARKFLINPMNFFGSDTKADCAKFFRIRVGASDADTAFTILMALRLANTGKAVDYALVWDQPHCQADYPGEVCNWIESLG